MRIQSKKLSDTSVQLTVEADAEQLAPLKEQTLKKLSNDVSLPGFRKGKVPANLVEKNIDQTRLQTEFLDAALNSLYGAALEQEQLRPVASPEVKIQKFVPFDVLEAQFIVEIIGEVKLSDYKKLKLSKQAATVTEKEVNDVLTQLKQREAERKEVKRASKPGDEVTIDFSGVDAKTKEPIAGADGKDYPLALGSNTFIPGFEPELIGLKPGEEKTFTIEFPKDYGVKALQSRKVSFTVTAKKVSEIVEPKLDSDFAAKIGPFKSLKELKDDIQKQLVTEKQTQAEQAAANEAIEKVTDASKVALPDVLIDEQVERLAADQKQNAMYRGQTWEDYLKTQDLTEETYKASVREQAERQVKAGLVLAAVAEAEQLNVTTEEIDARLNQLRTQYSDKQMRAELDKPETRREIASRILSDKTIEKLLSYAQKA